MVASEIELDHEISLLLAKKVKSAEKEMAPAIEPINKFIKHELERLENISVVQPDRNRDMNKLNSIFKDQLI